MMELPYNLGKASVNFFVGLMRKGIQEVNKVFYTKSFRQASTKFLENDDKKMFITKTEFNGDEVFKVLQCNNIETDY